MLFYLRLHRFIAYTRNTQKVIFYLIKVTKCAISSTQGAVLGREMRYYFLSVYATI